MYLRLLAFLVLFTALSGCGGNFVDDASETYTGIVVKPEVTTYQYGTHALETETDYFALRSSSINLDDYINQEVTLTTTKIAGYPVENGPILLEVEQVIK